MTRTTDEGWTGSCPTCGTNQDEIGQGRHYTGRKASVGGAQALADVRTLDDWQRAARGRRFWFGDGDSFGLIELIACGEAGTCEHFIGATPDEARAKAAAWFRSRK